MKYSKLGRTGLDVSRVCLGTMTFGEQTGEVDAHNQMDYALDQGVNFFDTAEIYSVPVHVETYGATEEIMGNWFEKTGKRDKVILASKIGGAGIGWVRDGGPITGDAIMPAIDNSLARLKTDYIDLYQLHWPNRPFPHFGRNHAGIIDFAEQNSQEIEDNLLDILQGLDRAVKSGKIRHVGLSDDSAWGIMKYVQLAEKHNLPRMASIQNEFSLMDRSDDPYVAEVCAFEDVAYLPWSPLGTGMINGKYNGGKLPEGSRWKREKDINSGGFSYRGNENSYAAAAGYKAVAEKHGIDVMQMALKFVDKQNFVTSTIIGATSMEQLIPDIAAFELDLSEDVMADIDAVYRQYPIPY